MREKIEGARFTCIHSRRYYIRDTGLAIYQANPVSRFGKTRDIALWRVGAEISPHRGITSADYNMWMKWVFHAQLYGKTFTSKEAALKAIDAIDIPFPL